MNIIGAIHIASPDHSAICNVSASHHELNHLPVNLPVMAFREEVFEEESIAQILKYVKEKAKARDPNMPKISEKSQDVPNNFCSSMCWKSFCLYIYKYYYIQ